MKKSLFLILLLLAPALVFTETLTIGTTRENPPFSSLGSDNNVFFGFDIDIMQEICHRINATCKFVPFMFNNLFIAITSNKLDLAVSGITITPYREQFYLFSLPYLRSSAQFVTNKTSGINKPDDLFNKRLGIRMGTPFLNLAIQMFGDQVKIVTFKSDDTQFACLSNDQCDAIVIDKFSALTWVANSGGLYKLVGSPIQLGDGYGIMANLSRGPLIARINQALLNMEGDGTYLKIYTQHFGQTKN